MYLNIANRGRYAILYSMADNHQEWLAQAEYDFQTAEFMFSGGRYVYTVFMIHLAIEKALKGACQKRFNAIQPRTHNLIYFVNKIEAVPPEHIKEFLAELNQASLATRYPQNLIKLQSVYTKDLVTKLLVTAKETLEWVKKTS